MEHYETWGAVIVWIILYALVLPFLPYYRKSGRKPGTAYLAFVTAFALEMFGIPFSLYFAAWAWGIQLPEGVFRGHTLINVIGLRGMYAGIAFMTAGLILIIAGWRQIFREYWSFEKGSGRLVQTGIYRYIRHPQYTGLIMITMGMMMEWITIPQLVLWPVIVVVYVKLALKEEKELEEEFGTLYLVYKDETGMFLPRI